MLSIIIVFPKLEDANNIKSLLIRNGYDVNAVCTTGAQAIGIANDLDDGIVISGYRMPDMMFHEINSYLPRGFQMILLAAASRMEEVTGDSIVAISMPMKSRDLIMAIQKMTNEYLLKKKRERAKLPKGRSEEEKATIARAKEILMERNHLTEEEAHRYIQKNSMDSGINMLEMAEMIIAML